MQYAAANQSTMPMSDNLRIDTNYFYSDYSLVMSPVAPTGLTPPAYNIAIQPISMDLLHAQTSTRADVLQLTLPHALLKGGCQLMVPAAAVASSEFTLHWLDWLKRDTCVPVLFYLVQSADGLNDDELGDVTYMKTNLPSVPVCFVRVDAFMRSDLPESERYAHHVRVQYVKHTYVFSSFQTSCYACVRAARVAIIRRWTALLAPIIVHNIAFP
jgi:hypothetical protein